MSARSSLRILLGSFLVIVPAACASTDTRDDPPAVQGALERLRELQPADIAVAPIQDDTEGTRVPLDLFRTAFVEALVERRYSPLAPSYVDQNWVEASFRGTPPPDALLVVTISYWNPTHLHSTGRVSATADVALFEGGDTTGRLLWRSNLTHEVDLGDGRGNPPTGGKDYIPLAVRKIAKSALEALPLRDPRLAHAATASE